MVLFYQVRMRSINILFLARVVDYEGNVVLRRVFSLQLFMQGFRVQVILAQIWQLLSYQVNNSQNQGKCYQQPYRHIFLLKIKYSKEFQQIKYLIQQQIFQEINNLKQGKAEQTELRKLQNFSSFKNPKISIKRIKRLKQQLPQYSSSSLMMKKQQPEQRFANVFFTDGSSMLLVISNTSNYQKCTKLSMSNSQQIKRMNEKQSYNQFAPHDNLLKFFNYYSRITNPHKTNTFLDKQPGSTIHNNNRSTNPKQKMQKSFLRVQDWAPIYNTLTNPCWLEILRIIDQFQQLVDTQKKEIIDCIKELTNKRVELIRLYNKYKNSLRFSGEIKKQVLSIYDSDKGKFFFAGYYGQIEEIMAKIGSNPRLLARMLARDNNKKLDNPDFIQSILYHLYPCHLPALINTTNVNHCLAFVQEVIQQWSYDIKLGRPSTYTVIDQIINGFNKTPEIVCYVQKISINFMKELNKCKMDYFAFDEQAYLFNTIVRIKHEFQMRRSMVQSQNLQQPKSRWGKFKSLFNKNQDKAETTLSVTSDASDPMDLDINVSDIMKARQKDFMSVVKQTIISILDQQTPFLLNQMLRFFHNKIKNQMDNSKTKHTNSFTTNQQQETKSNKDLQTTRQNSETDSNEQRQYFRHYCYFLMTNLVCEELHNKFTISHQDTGMRPADLQNITEIIKIITQIFQGHLPEGEKYKSQKLLRDLEVFIPKIPNFYDKILVKGSCPLQGNQQKPKLLSHVEQSQRIREILLKLHQNTLILSFNDIRALLSIIKPSSLIDELGLSEKSRKLQFLEDQKIKNIFEPTTKRVQFHQMKHEVDKIFFVFNSHKPSSKEVVQFYSGSESPLKELPLLTKSLMSGSNLSVTQVLEVTKSLQLLQTLSLKQAKYFLNKIAIRYSNLYLRDSYVLSDRFRETIQKNLNRSINRKSVLILHRDQICSRISFTQKLIQFYTEELRSSQFYDRISQAFIHNIKIKAYLKIENDELKIYQNPNQMKGVQLQTLLMTDGQEKSKKMSQDYILKTSFKCFTTISELLKSIVRSSITRSALVAGRRVEQFNSMFTRLCSIVVSYIEQFMKKRQILQNLNKQKLAKTIVAKIQNFIYDKAKGINTLEQDLALNMSKKKINREQFFKRDLEQLQVDWDFLFQEGKKKFDLMIDQKSIPERLRHFEQMFRMVFTIIGFSMAKNKISAQIINPIIQYLILVSNVTKHYECLFSLQTLKWNTSPQTCYNIILYESSLTYVSQMMSKDYPL